MKRFKLCRFCEKLDPYERVYYHTTAIWMCYENNDSCDKVVDSDACDKFEICESLKGVVFDGN